MPANDGIPSYVESAIQSTARARLVLIVVVTTSVLAFGALWNSLSFSWISKHVDEARAQLEASGCIPKSGEPSSGEMKPLDRPTTNEVGYQRSLTCELLMDRFKNYRRVAIEQVQVIKVPFFGISIDVNDLGIVAGFTFVVILIWFRYSLSRELTNLRIVFRDGRELGELKTFYDLLAMGQVLTVPPMPEETRGRLWRWIPKALYIFPAVIQAGIMINDGLTWKTGWDLSKGHTIVLYALSLVFLVFIIILTVNCFGLAIDMDKEWKSAAEKAQIVN